MGTYDTRGGTPRHDPAADADGVTVLQEKVQDLLEAAGIHAEDIEAIIDRLGKAEYKRHVWDEWVAWQTQDSTARVALIFPEERVVEPATICSWYRDAVANGKIIERDYFDCFPNGWYAVPSLDDMALALEDIGQITRRR